MVRYIRGDGRGGIATRGGVREREVVVGGRGEGIYIGRGGGGGGGGGG